MILVPARLGLVGCGRLAEVGYVPAAELTPTVQFVAFADPDAERRDLLAGTEARAHASAEELIEAGEVDGLVVASPPATHEPVAELAAAAGLPCLVEKPPAPDLEGAERLAALEPAPYVGFNRRFSLGRGLRDVLPEGGVIELELNYRRFSWAPLEVRDPALLDLAPHLVDLALRAGLGSPRSLAAGSSRPERVRIDIAGDRGRARIACACDRFHRERVVVRDAEGAVVERRTQGGLVRGVAQRLRPGPHPLVASLAAQLATFAAVVRGGQPGELATAEEGARVMALIACAARSLALGGERVNCAEGAVPL